MFTIGNRIVTPDAVDEEDLPLPEELTAVIVVEVDDDDLNDDTYEEAPPAVAEMEADYRGDVETMNDEAE